MRDYAVPFHTLRTVIFVQFAKYLSYLYVDAHATILRLACWVLSSPSENGRMGVAGSICPASVGMLSVATTHTLTQAVQYSAVQCSAVQCSAV